MRRALTIRRKLILAFLAVIVPFLLLQMYTHRSRLSARRILLLQAEIQRSRDVGHEFGHFIVNLRREAHAAGLAIAQYGQGWSPEKIRRYLRELRKDYKSIEFMAWASPEGEVRAVHPRVASPIDITDRDYYKRIVRGQTWALSDLVLSKVGGEPRFILAYGVRDRSGSLQGIMIAVVNPALLDQDLTLVNMTPGSTAIITDSAGRVVYHNRYPEMSLKDRDWSRVSAVKNALRGRWAYDYRTRLPLSRMDLIGAQTPVESLGWTAGAYSPLEAAMAPVVEDFRNSMLLGLLISLIVILAILVIGNHLSRPITELANAAAEVAGGKPSRRLEIHTGDEVELLANRFNLMTESLEQFRKITGQVLADTPIQDLLQSLVAGAGAVLRTQKAGVFLYDPQKRQIRHTASHGLSEEYIRFLSNTSAVPCGRAATSRQIEYVDFVSDPAFAADKELTTREQIGSAMCLPLLTAEDELLGVLAGYFPPGRKPEDEEVSALTFLSAQAAIALESAQLHEETKRRGRELQILWDVGQAVALKLDLDDLTGTLAERLKVLMQADDCCIALYNHNTGEITPLAQTLAPGTMCPADRALRCADLAIRAVQMGRPAFVETLEARSESGSTLSVPMTLRGYTMGSICMFKHSGHFEEDDVRLASALAGVAAIAIENARSYTKERRIAETLQEAFISATDFTDESIEIAEVYRPAMDEASIGGDFFDVMRLPGGKFGIVIADVAGKGLQAAVHTAMVKYMLQAYAYQNQSPAEALTNLNKALIRQLSPDSFVTLFFMIVDPCGGDLVYANAGHEMPLLRRRDALCEPLDVTGPALGTTDGATYSERTLRLSSGSMLAMYTDGISEARANGEFFGMEGIQRLMEERSPDSAGNLASAIVDAASEYAGGHLHDDVAVLTVKFTGHTQPGTCKHQIA
ncbi:MAG: SpoIIE family protein phosphatase [Armatimonadota bacterium]|nr:SpoIIE family protein phosphatase [Armatimonadota bacterium]